MKTMKLLNNTQKTIFKAILFFAFIISSTVSKAADTDTNNNIISFSANLKNSDKVEINWVTAFETNLNYYVIEKSRDGANFSDAGIVFTNGSTLDKTSYSVQIKAGKENTGLVYYRLSLVNEKGESQYSKLITVNFE